MEPYVARRALREFVYDLGNFVAEPGNFLFGIPRFLIGLLGRLLLGRFKPGRNFARWNGLFRQMGNDGAGGNDESFLEFHSREILGFGFGRKGPG
jgi:hypothetical protein